MKRLTLRKVRLVIALLFLVLTLFLLLDFTGILPTRVYTTIIAFQFVPSLLKFITSLTIGTAAFILIMVATTLIGRVYCSAVCPLGLLQDVIVRIKKRIPKKKLRYKYNKAYNVLRYSFFIVTVVTFLLGTNLVLNLLDPYSNFGRITSGLFRPLYIGGNNILAFLLEKINVYSVYHIDQHFRFDTMIYPLVVLITLVMLSIRHGRLFCNTVCPVGTLLGLISRISLFKIVFDTEKCTSCNRCSLLCKSECINVKEMKVDFSRCVACYNCIDVCPESAINYQIAISKEKNISSQGTEGRRNFISKSATTFIALFGISKLLKGQQDTVMVNGHVLEPINKNYPVSPPGSFNIDRFNDLCTACNLCVSACPSEVIKPSLLEYGLKGFLQPHLDYRTGYCNYECTVCTEVCPTGALLPISVETKKTTQLGVVNFIEKNCIVFTKGTACGACAEHCPSKAVFMVPYKNNLTIPDTNTSICVGCGACEKICPVEPHYVRAIYVDGHAVHKKAQKPVIKEEEYEELEEFPF